MREELTSFERLQLSWRMQVNYYGYWINKVVHGWLCYKAFKLGMFAASTAELLFWKRFTALNVGTVASIMCVDSAVKYQLFLYCEDLRERYGTELDAMRLDYLQDKTYKRIAQIGELQRLADMGKQVREILHHVTQK